MRDNVSDLQWNINRWYDANVGRWCSEDPIGFRGKDENLYRYADNMVMLRSDFGGLKSEETGVKFCAGYQKGAWVIGGVVPIHWFIAIDGVGIGKFETNLQSIGTGDIRFDDLLVYPNVSPDNLSDGDYYSQCTDILLESDCYDLLYFKTVVRNYANLPAGIYVAGVWDCRDWIFSAVYDGVTKSRARKPGYFSFCKCAFVYANEDSTYIETADGERWR
jgi:RHS repeat-associated protein